MKTGLGEILLISILSVVLAGTCLAGENMEADNLPVNEEVGEQAGQHGEWDIKLGAGAMVGPRYEGGDEYVAFPLPYFSVTWRDIISLGADGLTVNVWRGSNFQLGAGLTYNPGRTEEGSNIWKPFSGFHHGSRLGPVFLSSTPGPVSRMLRLA